MTLKFLKGGHSNYWVPAGQCAALIVAWLVSAIAAVSVLAPTDGYELIARMVAAPQIWCSMCAGLGAWHFATLRAHNALSRPSTRAPLAVIIRLIVPILWAVAVSTPIAYLAIMAYFNIFQVQDAHLILVVTAMGLGCAMLGGLLGTYLPRLWSTTIAVLLAFCVTYLPATMKTAWVRSLVGGNWAPELRYKIDDRTLIGTSLFFVAVGIYAAYMISRRTSQPQLTRTMVAATLAVITTALTSIHTVKDVGYVPVAARAITTICSGTSPNWCVLPDNAAYLPSLVSLNEKIRQVETETGARWPDTMSEAAMPGPRASLGVEGKDPMYLPRNTSSAVSPGQLLPDVTLALSRQVPQCDSVGFFQNLTAAVMMSDWWSDKILGKPALSSDDAWKNDPAREIFSSMTPEQQGLWVNSILYAPNDCKSPLIPLGRDAQGNPIHRASKEAN